MFILSASVSLAMRSVLVAVTVLCAVTMHAEPTFRFFTDQPSSGIGADHKLFVENTSEESALDVAVTIELPEELTFRDTVSAIPEWTCTTAERTRTCRVATMAPAALASLFFRVDAADFGGHHAVTATLTARDLNTP